MPLPAKRVSIDTESTGLEVRRGARMICGSATFPDGTVVFERSNKGDFPKLKAIVENPDIDKVFHNRKHDERVLRREGITLKGKGWDTMIFGHLLCGMDAGKKLSLDHMSRKYAPHLKKVVDPIDTFFQEAGISKANRNFADLPHDILRARNIGDSKITMAMFDRMFDTVEHHFNFLLQQEHDLIPVVMDMEDRGICIDPEELEKQYEVLTAAHEECLHTIECITGNDFNINSKAHQIDLLRRAGVLSQISERTKTGQPKLDDYNLRTLHHPVAHTLLLAKATQKLRDGFLMQMKALQIDGVVYPNFNQLGTVTGRFSCSNPNLQNIPIEGNHRTSLTEDEAEEAYEATGINYAPHIKGIFQCRPGYSHIHADKKQAEMVMLAHYSRSTTLIKLVESGTNIHEGLCMLLYGELTKGLKTRTKAVVFGFQYGAGLKTLAKKIGGTIDDAQATKQRLARILPDLPRWQRELANDLARRGYVDTIHGRRHYLPRDLSYMSVNRVCQGSVGDEIKSRMVALHKEYKVHALDARVLLNIHDDIGNEVAHGDLKVAVPLINDIMHQTSKEYRTRLASSLDITHTRWSDLKEIANPKDYKSYAPSKHNHRH